jgi:hypothetical protein
MVRKIADGNVTIFCEFCNDETGHDLIDMEPYCPECGEKITVCSKCCTGYFCNTCNSLKSSKKIIWKKSA